MNFICLLLSILFLTNFLIQIKGELVVPDEYEGSFSVIDIHEKVYRGSFKKTLDEAKHWLIEAILRDHHDETYGSVDVEMTFKDEKENFHSESRYGVEDKCVPHQDVPPLSLLKETFQNAEKVDMKTTNITAKTVVCESGDLWKLQFTGDIYLLCLEKGFDSASLYGETFEAKIERSDSFPNVEIGEGCKPSSYIAPKTPDNIIPWYSKDIVVPSKDCYFLHGSGVEPDVKSQGIKDYWGDMKKYAKKCSTFHFNNMDTANRGWDNVEAAKEVCEFLDPDDQGVLENKVIFSHSMGNLIMANAIRLGLCSLSSSSSWYNVQGPVIGSEAAVYVEEGCKDPTSAVRIVAALTGSYCNGEEAYKAYQSLVPGYPGLSEVKQIVVDNIKGAMCGTDSWGLHTIYSPALALIEQLTGFNKANDGMVSYESCGVIGDFVSNNKDALFYRPSVNHADGTGVHDDGWWGSDRKPASWFNKD